MGTGEPSGELKSAIEKDFGSFDEFKKQFSTAGATQFGSGWAWLVSDEGKLKVCLAAKPCDVGYAHPDVTHQDIVTLLLLCLRVPHALQKCSMWLAGPELDQNFAVIEDVFRLQLKLASLQVSISTGCTL